MAGRGTDIMLGGNWQMEVAKINDPTEEQIKQIKADWKEAQEAVLAAGGLHIISAERHESRRIDNQLRGRSGRQGDPGSSRFYLSLEDGLMRIFASDKVKNLMQTLGMQKGEAIEHRWVSKSIENAQKKVEGRNFDIRKSLLEYDDVANDQRQVIYQQRDELLESEDISDTIASIRHEVVNSAIDAYIPPESVDEQWDIPGLEKAMQTDFRVDLPVAKWLEEDDRLFEEGIRERILNEIIAAYEAKGALAPEEGMLKQVERHVMLTTLDRLWKEHLASMDHLKQGIHLRGYAQKNPKQEYKREAYELFEGLLDQIKQDVVRILSSVEFKQQDDAEALERQRREAARRQQMELQHADASAVAAEQSADALETDSQTFKRAGEKVGRNDPCPCGSEKKYKHCHGKVS